MSTWQMQEAKSRLSELVKRAQIEGPQDITVHGKSVAIVLSLEAYKRLTSPAVNFADFIRASPLFGQDEMNFERDTSLSRELDV